MSVACSPSANTPLELDREVRCRSVDVLRVRLHLTPLFELLESQLTTGALIEPACCQAAGRIASDDGTVCHGAALAAAGAGSGGDIGFHRTGDSRSTNRQVGACIAAGWVVPSPADNLIVASLGPVDLPRSEVRGPGVSLAGQLAQREVVEPKQIVFGFSRPVSKDVPKPRHQTRLRPARRRVAAGAATAHRQCRRTLVGNVPGRCINRRALR